MDLYKDIILDHYKHPRHWGKIKHPSVSIEGNNPFCGDLFEFDVSFKKNLIEAIKFRGQGCAISIASASMLTDYLQGKPKESLKKLDKDFMIKLLGIKLGPTRLKCALLPLETIQKILNLKS